MKFFKKINKTIKTYYLKLLQSYFLITINMSRKIQNFDSVSVDKLANTTTINK